MTDADGFEYYNYILVYTQPLTIRPVSIGPFSYKPIMYFSGLIKNPLFIGGSFNTRDEENGRIYCIKTHRHGEREDEKIKEKYKSYLWPFISLKISARFIDHQPLNQFTTSLHQSSSTPCDEENGCIYSVSNHIDPASARTTKLKEEQVIPLACHIITIQC